MPQPPAVPVATPFRRLFPPLSLIVTALVLSGLILQVSKPSADSGTIGGTAIIRFGSEYGAGSGYDRYSYVLVGYDNAQAAGTLPTRSIVYMSGTTVMPLWSQGVTYEEALQNDWLLRDANGQYVRNVNFGGYIGDIGDSGYQQRFIDNVGAFLSQNGNEGVFIDDVTPHPATITHGVFPAKYPTPEAWENAMLSFLSRVGPALQAQGFYVLLNAGVFISGNSGSDDGSLVADFWRKTAPHANGLMSEYWEQLPPDPSQLRPSGAAAWSQHWDGWLSLVDVAQDAGADFFGLMEGSASDLNHMRYGKASFLLEWDGAGGAFLYHAHGDPWHPEWTMDIGQPAGAKYQVGVGWRREYSGGTAIVNPSPSSSQTFSLGATYTQADGTAVTSVTLGPVSGLVLKSTAPSPPPPPPPPPPPSAPANTALPVISGAPQQGATLTATTGSWSNSPTAYAYQWKRCDSSGANCASVSGATAAQYGLGGADVGKRLRVTVTASNASGSGSATSNATSVVTSAPPLPPPPPGSTTPTNTAPPVISGLPQQGATLTASTGSWSNSPTGFAYQWKRCDATGASCASLPGSTGPQNTLGPHAVGKTLRVTVTASNASGSASATSDATEVVAPVPAPTPPQKPKVSERPVISGMPQEGVTLSTTTGTWTNSPTLFGYQWRRCNTSGGGCESIAGARGPQYTVGPADVGQTLRVVLDAWNDAGVTHARTDQTDVIAPRPAPLPPRNVVSPSIVGSFRVGSTLQVAGGEWSGDPSRWTYQWRRCGRWTRDCEDIPGATSPTYLVDREDTLQCLVVVVTAWNSGGSSSASAGLPGLHCSGEVPTPD